MESNSLYVTKKEFYSIASSICLLILFTAILSDRGGFGYLYIGFCALGLQLHCVYKLLKARSTKELAGYNVTVRPGSSLTSTTQILGKHTLTVGKTKVSIKKNEIFVNGASYGQLKTGDTILVENKKVTVSGKVRETKEGE